MITNAPQGAGNNAEPTRRSVVKELKVEPTPRELVTSEKNGLCFKCGATDGHWARDCPQQDCSKEGCAEPGRHTTTRHDSDPKAIGATLTNGR